MGWFDSSIEGPKATVVRIHPLFPVGVHRLMVWHLPLKQDKSRFKSEWTHFSRIGQSVARYAMRTFHEWLLREAFLDLPGGGRVLIRPPTQHQPIGYLDFDNIGRHNPQLKTILADLLKQQPEIVDYQLKFDGPGFSTVAQYLSQVQHPSFSGMPSKWYHGTSAWAWSELISKEGLRPRSTTGATAAYGANISSAPAGNPDLVYLMDNDGNAVRFAARNANGNAVQQGHADSVPVILEIDGRGINPAYLEPDVDSRARNWQESLWTLGSVGYRRAIPPGFIKLHMSWSDKTWKNS